MSITTLDIVVQRVTFPDGTTTDSTAEYQSYATLAEANLNLAVDLVRNTAWSALDDNDKRLRLVAATRRLDVLNWAGRKTGGPTQAGAWPRTGLTFPDGSDVPSNDVPAAITLATSLLAGSIAGDAAHSDVTGEQAAIRSVSAGSVSVDFSERSTGRTTTANQVQDPAVHALVSQWLAGGGAYGGASGTDATSDLTDRFRVNEGLA